jgi:hypothetical protein
MFSGYIPIDREGVKVKNWYKNMTKGQKLFVYFVSAGLVLVYGIGLLPLAVLIYLGLGERGRAE